MIPVKNNNDDYNCRCAIFTDDCGNKIKFDIKDIQIIDAQACFAKNFIGSWQNFERIGIIYISLALYDYNSDEMDIVAKKIESDVELLQSSYIFGEGKLKIVGISDHFNLVHRDDVIPEYDVLVKVEKIIDDGEIKIDSVLVKFKKVN